MTAGCGPKGLKNVVEGKVTLKGAAVNGKVIFHGTDGKKAESPIDPKGEYHVSDPPLGDCKISIEPFGAGVLGGVKPPPPDMKPKTKGKKDKSSEPEGGFVTGASSMGVDPPAKYKDPNTSGLKYTVKGGKEKHDIEL